MPKVSLDFDNKKEIKVLMLKGEAGKTSYDLAVEEELFSGTLEEWIETFATPENYITRTEFQKVTQAQYDELKARGELITNCFYLIVDDDSYDNIIEKLDGLEDNDTNLRSDITANTTSINNLSNQAFKKGVWVSGTTGTTVLPEDGYYIFAFSIQVGSYETIYYSNIVHVEINQDGISVSSGAIFDLIQGDFLQFVVDQTGLVNLYVKTSSGVPTSVTHPFRYMKIG